MRYLAKVAFLTFFAISKCERDPTVDLSDGRISGTWYTSPSGKKSKTFQGIPYAKAPLASLRFKRPAPPDPWNETLLCQKFRPACPQTRNITQDEDCLYLNVASGLNCSQKTPCNVLFFIHGGGNEFLSPILYTPDVMTDNFASKNIVMVTVSYRLGVLGFFSTGTNESMGNWGMEDIVFALQWVQREIENFGGRPDNVTLWGYSSSSSLISLLTLSPRTAGLFQKTVCMSGAAFNNVKLQNDVSAYWNLASDLGCWNNSQKINHENLPEKTNALIDCMRNVSVDRLLVRYDQIRHHDPVRSNVTKNMSMPRNDGPDGLFPLPEFQLVENRRPVDTLTGTTRNEFGNVKPDLENATRYTVTETCESLINRSQFGRKDQLIQACTDRYVVNPDYNGVPPYRGIYSFWTEQTVELTEDFIMFAPCFWEAWTLTRAGSRVFLYSFDFEKTGKEDVSTSHGTDMDYLADAVLPKSQWDWREWAVRDRYLGFVVNFIKYGDPTPRRHNGVSDGIRWPVFQNSSPYSNNYMSIDVPLSVKTGYHRSAVKFWDFDVPAIENGTLKWGIGQTDDFENFVKKSLTNLDEEKDEKVETTSLYAYLVITLLISCLAVVFMLSKYRQKRNKYEQII